MAEREEGKLPTILVADDHPSFQSVLERLMAGVAEVLPPVTSLPQLDEVLASGTLPDLLVLDLVFGDDYSIPRLRIIRRDHPEFRIIVYTGLDDHRICAGVMKAGANGYLVKPESLDVVKEALLEVLHGGTWVSSSVVAIPGEQVGVRDKELTHTQRLIVLQRAQGLRNKEVADMMGVTKSAVESQVTKIRKICKGWPEVPYLGDDGAE